MNSGVTVVLCIVGALVLCEAVLPRIFEVFWKWWWERAQKEIGTQLPSANVNLAKTDVATTARNTAPTPQSVFAKVDANDGADDDAALAFSDSGVARAEKERKVQNAGVEDLTEVYEAARRGGTEAMLELGNYAYWRGAIVEAFYWTILAELKGKDGLDEVLFDMRTRWLAEGCPDESENAYAEFTEEQGEFARTVLCLQCDIDPQHASARLQELADAGNEAAQLFVQVAKEEVES